MTTFIEDSSNYLGETVTAEPRHALEGDRGMVICDHHPLCGAVKWADGPLAGRVLREVSDEYEGRHRWNVRRHRQAPWDGAR